MNPSYLSFHLLDDMTGRQLARLQHLLSFLEVGFRFDQSIIQLSLRRAPQIIEQISSRTLGRLGTLLRPGRLGRLF